jgi:hypothetical protein
VGDHELPARRGSGALRRLRPRRRRSTETEEYAAMLLRLIYRYGERIAGDPAAAVHLAELKQALGIVGNIGLFAANTIGEKPWSVNELAALMGISKQSVHEQVRRGEGLFAELAAARQAGALVRIADLRKLRAARLAAPALEDRRQAEAGGAGE